MALTLGLCTKLAQVQLIFLTACLILNTVSNGQHKFLANGAETKETRSRRSSYSRRRVWPNGVIPYVIDCSIANVPDAKETIRAAMDQWEKRTCIRFVKRTNQRGYVLIKRSNGCWAHVGYSGRQVTLSVGDGCEFIFVMMHELGHTIGFDHEHNRHDRDEFIEIFWDNIMNSRIKEFYKRRKNSVKFESLLPYDYSSIMHYRFNAFAKNRSVDTIGIRDKNSTKRHRPYRYITDLDVNKTLEMYNCPSGKPKVKNEAETEIEEAVNPDALIEVSLKSSGWLANKIEENIASIIVNGTEVAQNRQGMNVVLLNYLSGRVTVSAVYSISTKNGGWSFGQFIRNIPRRNYFLIVSKEHSFYYLKEAKEAMKSIGIKLPYIRYGSSLCFVGYKGDEKVRVKQVISNRRKKATFLMMKLILAQEYRCQDDLPNCVQRAKRGHCAKYPLYLLKVCQKSCAACQKGKPCKDEHKYCSRWAKLKHCFRQPGYMLRKCKVSCKVCRKALPAEKKRKIKKKRKVEISKKPVKTASKIPGNKASKDDENSATGSRCVDKSRTCPFWARHRRCITDSWVKKNCLISCIRRDVCDMKQLRPEGSCSNPFGIGWDRTLPDSAFNASSFLSTGGNWTAAPSNARLYMEDDFDSFRIGAWCADEPPKGEWLRIDLGKVKKITAVATQGRFRYYEHVKTYRLSFSIDGKRWTYYREGRRTKVFKGNCDHITPMLHALGRRVKARYVRFHPIKYYGGICMRVEVYGC